MKSITIILILFSIVAIGKNRSIRTWEKEDKMALSITNKEAATIDGLIQKIKSFHTDDWGRFRITFRWIADHIVYDVVSYKTNRVKFQSAEETIRKRKAVCSGYAELLKEIAVGLGIKTEVISGFVKQDGVCHEKYAEANHAWNAAEIDGSWYLFDVTWASGKVNEKINFYRKDFEDFFFAPVPEKLLFNHLPVDPKWQLVKDTVTRAEFESRCSVSVALFKLGLNVESISKVCPTLQCPMVEVNYHSHIHGISKAEIPFEKVLTSGTAYSFTFNAPGTFRFYIQNEPPAINGKVILYEHWITDIPYKKNVSSIIFTPQPGELSVTVTENGKSEKVFVWLVR